MEARLWAGFHVEKAGGLLEAAVYLRDILNISSVNERITAQFNFLKDLIEHVKAELKRHPASLAVRWPRGPQGARYKHATTLLV